MEFLNLFLYLSITVPLLVVLIMSRSKTKTLICFLIMGLTCALFCGEINGLLHQVLPYSERAFVTTFTPIIEEIFKVIPIFICAFIAKPSRQNLIEYSIALGVGFAVLENAFIFATGMAEITFMTAILRAFGSGMVHVMTTLVVGFGLTFVNNNRKLFYSGSVGLIATAIIYHSIYNYLVCCGYYVAGFIMPTLVFIPTMIYIKKLCQEDKVIKQNKKETNNNKEVVSNKEDTNDKY